MRKTFLFFILFPIFCIAQKITNKSFYPCANLTDLTGTYLNNDKKLSKLFSINADWVYFITLKFDGNNELKLVYPTSSGLDSVFYKGKFKKNYFEIYFSKKLIPIPFFFGKKVNRIRIGHNENSDLLIQHYDDHFGWIVFFAAGDTNEDEFTFKKIENIKELKPYLSNNRWGYTDSIQNVVIEPQYDFVEFFNNKVSRVKQNGKWGLINDKGMELTPIKYDTIHSFNKNCIAKVLLGDKEGCININGNEIISPVYDYINDNVYRDSTLIKINYKGKRGYLNTEGETIILPVYDNVDYIANDFFKITLNGKIGYLNKQGKVLIPPIYEVLGNIVDSSSIVVFSEDGKYGYRTVNDIICPPVFDKASNRFTTDLSDICVYAKYNETPYLKVIYKGAPYLADQEGYLYKYKCLNTIRRKFVILEESKIKVTDLENIDD